ncbi:MAG: membrane integrity-associated transporter subunit PqiC, partial [Gemmatimonadetes bacterium]|nr:membrane integrity-associated transporter subunit PqiC [Gemmatimonadota bacterium]
ELRYMETERWGEPLEEAFLYALGVNLGVLLGTDEVILHPWYATEKPEFAVMVDVVRFERDQQGAAHLVVRWELRDASGAIVATDGFRVEEEAADPTSVSSSVQAQSRTVAALSRQISDAIRKAAT